MSVNDTKQTVQAPGQVPVCERVCESPACSTSEKLPAGVEMLAIQRDRRTGRYSRRERAEPELSVQDEVGQSLGAETRFASGNQNARRHGVRAFETTGATTLPPEMRRELETFQAGLETDQGGGDELTTIGVGYVRRLTELEGCLLLLAVDLQTRGLLTARGRVRSSYALLLQTIDRWDKLAHRLGMTRRTKRLPSLHEYLELGVDRHASDDDVHGATALKTTSDSEK
jgi:hypothetical protein